MGIKKMEKLALAKESLQTLTPGELTEVSGGHGPRHHHGPVHGHGHGHSHSHGHTRGHSHGHGRKHGHGRGHH
jgi:hypothetical protein